MTSSSTAGHRSYVSAGVHYGFGGHGGSSGGTRGGGHREAEERLKSLPCPNCGCRQSNAIEFMIRCCDACQHVFGYDDSTADSELFVEDATAAETPSGDAASRWDRRDRNRDGDGRGYRRDSGGDSDSGCGSGYGRNQHASCHRQQPRHGGDGGGRGGDRSSGDGSSSSSGLTRSASVDSALVSAAIGVGTRVLGEVIAGGDFGSSLARAGADSLEPIGATLGAAVGAVTGSMIGSPRAADICQNLGASVGRGVADMVRDSAVLNPGAAGGRGRGADGQQQERQEY